MFGKIYHSRQACLANRITYDLVPEQLSFFKRWQVSPIKVQFNKFRSEYWITDPLEPLLIPIPRLVTSDPGPVVPYPTPFLAFDPWFHIPCCDPVTESSVRATVSKMARMFWRCPHEVINIEIPTVSHLNVDRPRAAIIVGKTDLPGDQAFSYSGVTAV